jgi:hypothetical protein
MTSCFSSYSAITIVEIDLQCLEVVTIEVFILWEVYFSLIATGA